MLFSDEPTLYMIVGHNVSQQIPNPGSRLVWLFITAKAIATYLKLNKFFWKEGILGMPNYLIPGICKVLTSEDGMALCQKLSFKLPQFAFPLNVQ